MFALLCTGVAAGAAGNTDGKAAETLSPAQSYAAPLDERMLHGVIVGETPLNSYSGRDLLLGDGSNTLHLRLPEEVLRNLSFAAGLKPGVSLSAIAESHINANGDQWYEVASPADIKLKLIPLAAAIRVHEASLHTTKPEKRWERVVAAVATALAAGVGSWLIYYRRRANRALRVSLSQRHRAEEALRHGHARLQHLLSANSGVIYSLVPDTNDMERFTFISENVEQLLGYAPEECVHMPGWWRDQVHPDELRIIETGMRTVLRTGTLDREFRMLKKDGSYTWIHDRQRLQRDANGAPHEVVGTWMDISDRKSSEKIKEVFASLGARLGAVSTPKEAAAFIIRAADAIFGWDSAFVGLYHEESRQLRDIINFDTIDGRKQEVATTRTPLRPLTQKVLNGEPQIILRQQGVPESESELTRFGQDDRRSESLLFAPITHKKTVIGMLSIQSYSSRAYNERDLQVLQILANYCSAALMRTFAEEDRKAVEEALRESEQRYALALRGANDGLWDWDFRANSIYYSPRWKSMLGYTEHELTDSTDEWKSRIHAEDIVRVRAELARHLQGGTPQLEIEYRMQHKDSSYRWMLFRGVAVRDADGNPLRMAGSMTDITQRRKAEQQLLQGAYYDALTSLPNRLLFLEQLRRALGRAERREDFLFSVLFLDLDRFKIINDSLGHLVGDKLLVHIAERLRICIRPEDMVARLGGDEFTVLLEDIEEPAQATRVAERIQEEISKPFQLEGHDVWTTASIGIAFSSTGYSRPEDILRDADAAMYRAKAKGKARHELFDHEMHSRALKLLQTEAELRRAIERSELCVHYQPLFDLTTKRITGFEALVRWNHPERGLVMPAEFVPIAEETGLISQIGSWVLTTACWQLASWRKLLPADQELTISINVSRKQFSQPDLLARLHQILQQTGSKPEWLALEITESVLMEHTDGLIRLLTELKGLGVQLHVDDFGTGYSSLAYLHRFPIDKLKIDRSFVSHMESAGRNAEIVRAIVTLAHGLGMGTIAEGIETEEQAKFLCSLKCQLGQGYLLGRPVPTQEATAMLLNAVGAENEADLLAASQAPPSSPSHTD